MKYNHFFAVTLASLFVLGLVGCSNPDAQFMRVEGTVTYNGNPVEGATVTFMAVDAGGTSASGRTDASGRFTLTSSGATGTGTGALPGEYQVTISKREFPTDPDQEAYERGDITYEVLQQRIAARGSMAVSARAQDLLPVRYSQAGESGFTATVVQGRNAPFEFNLTD